MTRTREAVYFTNSFNLGPAFRKNGNQENCGVQRESVVLRLADPTSPSLPDKSPSGLETSA